MTIMAALARQESESLSANVRLGIQFRNQQGKVQVNHRIYAEYMDGASFLQIKRGLEEDGILNDAGNKNGKSATSDRSLPIRSTSAMRFCRRPTHRECSGKEAHQGRRPGTEVLCGRKLWGDHRQRCVPPGSG